MSTGYDWTRCPESAGPISESDFGKATYGDPGMPTIGAIPHLLPPEQRNRENDERYRAWLSVPPEVRAAKELIEQEMRRQGKP
jgi:hypothetical protein